MRTVIKAADAGDLFIMPKSLKPVCQQSRFFRTSSEGSAVIVNCTSPYRSGQVEIKFDAIPREPVTCAFAGRTSAKEFEIPANVDSLILVHSDQELKLTYDNAPAVPKPEHTPKPELIPKPAPVPKPITESRSVSVSGNKAFAELQAAFVRAVDEAAGQVSPGTDKDVIAIREQICEKMLEPYRSSDKHKETILAEQLLYITRCILSSLIDASQEEADNSTLPKS